MSSDDKFPLCGDIRGTRHYIRCSMSQVLRTHRSWGARRGLATGDRCRRRARTRFGRVADLPSRRGLGAWSACVFGLEFGLGIVEEGAVSGPFPECCDLPTIPKRCGLSPGSEAPRAPARDLSPVTDSG